MAIILVIDDEEQMRNLLNKMLIRDGHQVFIAQNGVEGVEYFHHCKPDIVITDIIMPKKDGFELISDIRKINPNQLIIAMSGGRRDFNASYNLHSVEMLGVKGILQKTFAHQQLQEVVQLALS
jgi:DNA-binding response OmpR family regulator